MAGNSNERTIREIRHSLGLSTDFVASKLNLKRPNYLRRERGEVDWTLDEVKAFSILTGVPIEQIKS